ncbi:MAG: hypothetical protein RJB13_1067, partial [Pseudomonadota bacterium]
MILVVDFGSQFTEVLHRVVRDAGAQVKVVSAEQFSSPELKANSNINGVILSGGPHSVYENEAPSIDPYWLNGERPVLGICYGMQLMAHVLGGKVGKGSKAEYGPAQLIYGTETTEFFPPETLEGQVWMSHGDHVSHLPPGFTCLAKSHDDLFAMIAQPEKKLFGIQFHPEVVHSENGKELIKHFIHSICAVRITKSDSNRLDTAESLLKQQLTQLDTHGDIICALSGGVDSTVAATLVSRAIGDRLHCIFVDTGLLRKNEFESTLTMYREKLKLNVHAVNASELFLDRLKNVSDPEQKRKIIGATFIDVFERESQRFNACCALVQGTIASDVIESSHSSAHAQVIKSHHNVGGLPER